MIYTNAMEQRALSEGRTPRARTFGASAFLNSQLSTLNLLQR